MTVYVEDLDGGYLHPQLEMVQREVWGRDPGGGLIKIVDSPAYAGPHSLQVTTSSTNVTNLITNPSFETNTTGWSVALQANVNAAATSITRITTDFYVGAASATVVFPATLDAGARFAITGTFTTGVTYGFSLAVKSVSGATDFRIKLVSTGTPASLNAVQTVTASGSWQRFNFTVTPTGTVSDVFLAITRATASAATANIDASMAYLGSSVTPSHFDTTGTYFNALTARSDQQLDLSEFDGVGIFLFSPSVSFLSNIKLRFLTSFTTLTNGDTNYANVDGACWFEYTIPGLGGDAVITYGSGVYAVNRYSSSNPTSILWTEVIIPKSAFTTMGNSGLPSWGDIARTEVLPQNSGGGAVTVYVDEISGWIHHLPEDAEANRMISVLPPFMWDTDASQQFFQVLGWEMDRLYGTANRGLDQRFVQRADWGLDLHEVERGFAVDQPGSISRRQDAASHTTSQAATTAEFEEHLSEHFSDGGANITEYPAEYRVEVTVAVNSQSDRNRVIKFLQNLIPAHLQVSITYDSFLAGQIVGSPLGSLPKTGTTESAALTDTGSQP